MLHDNPNVPQPLSITENIRKHVCQHVHQVISHHSRPSKWLVWRALELARVRYTRRSAWPPLRPATTGSEGLPGPQIRHRFRARARTLFLKASFFLAFLGMCDGFAPSKMTPLYITVYLHCVLSPVFGAKHAACCVTASCCSACLFHFVRACTILSLSLIHI